MSPTFISFLHTAPFLHCLKQKKKLTSPHPFKKNREILNSVVVGYARATYRCAESSQNNTSTQPLFFAIFFHLMKSLETKNGLLG